MNLILTNFGHRFIIEQLKNHPEVDVQTHSDLSILCQVLKDKFISVSSSDTYQRLVNSGYLETVDNVDVNAIDFRYKTNPLENVSRIVFEFTTRCNFNCRHCRNGYIQRNTETDVEKLKSIADTFGLLNINRFDFIGGEVTKYGNGWLELAAYINRNHDKTVTVFTNGWWLENDRFDAAGRHYLNDAEYLTDLKQNGVTHVVFSIDEHEEYHDKSRNHKGLYHKIISSFRRVKQAGMLPRVSAMMIDGVNILNAGSLAEIAAQMYDLPDNYDFKSAIGLLINDPTNTLSHLIDVGNGVQLKKNKYRISDIPENMLHCKAFYRPAPNLRIMANGNLSVCPLLDGGEDYGNIHNQSINGILNNFQQSFGYKLHANKELASYLKYYDTIIFGEYFHHICSVRVILTLLARYLQSETQINDEVILQINKKIARYSGHEASGR